MKQIVIVDVLRFLFTISHDQSNVERGVSANSDIAAPKLNNEKSCEPENYSWSNQVTYWQNVLLSKTCLITVDYYDLLCIMKSFAEGMSVDMKYLVLHNRPNPDIDQHVWVGVYNEAQGWEISQCTTLCWRQKHSRSCSNLKKKKKDFVTSDCL